MAIERNWATISIGPISVSGSIITVPTTFGLKAKQKIALTKPLILTKTFEIKRVMTSTTILVGDPSKPIGTTADATEFDGGTLTMFEQERNTIGGTPIIRSVYDEEPTCALRVSPVDWMGNRYTDDNPFPINVKNLNPIDVAVMAPNRATAYKAEVNILPSVLIPATYLNRVSFLIKNISEDMAIWIGFTEDECDTAEGYPLVAGEFISIDLSEDQELWARSDTDGADIRIIEVARDV